MVQQSLPLKSAAQPNEAPKRNPRDPRRRVRARSLRVAGVHLLAHVHGRGDEEVSRRHTLDRDHHQHLGHVVAHRTRRQENLQDVTVLASTTTDEADKDEEEGK